jgi:hypothetical protein
MKTMVCSDMDTSVLRCYARKDNSILFNSSKLNVDYDPQNFESIKFNSPKITSSSEKQNDDIVMPFFPPNINKRDSTDTDVEHAMKLFLNDKNNAFCILCIISGCNTGKTTFIKKSIKKYPKKMKRCLFITHRRMLAYDIERNFAICGFINYLDKEYFSPADDKLIVNMDSLKCLQLFTNYFTQQITLYKYDVLILDEFASLLNNFESSLMENKRNDIHNIFNRLILETPKIVILDADMSNREYQYLANLFKKNQIIVYQNLYKQESYHFIFTKDEIKFLEEIESDLNKKRNIVITCISSKKSLEFEQYFSKKKFKVLCITGDSDTETKKLLVDVEKIFNKDGYQVFIYSPALSVGNDINLPYFYKQYGYICTGAVCARDYMQMMFRVRQLENKNITILVNKSINTSKYANFYTIEEVFNMLSFELGKNINNLTTFEKLRMWNYWEDINSKHYFFQVLLHFINKKNYTYKIDSDELGDNYYGDLANKKKEVGINSGDYRKNIINGIVNADTITAERVSELFKKQKDGEISEKEKWSIEKYVYKRKFNLDDSDVTYLIINKIYGKKYIVDNYNKLFGKNNDGDNKKDYYVFDDETKFKINNTDLSEEIKNKRIKWIEKLLNILGFAIVDKKISDIKIIKDDFDKNKEKIIGEIGDEFKLLFKMKKSKTSYLEELLNDENMKKNKKFMGFINVLFGMYGIKIENIKKSKRVGKETVKIFYYKLNTTDIINIYQNNY